MTLLELVKSFEGCKLTAYKCPAGKMTIGYGCTHYLDGSPVQEGDKITQEDADIMLQKMLDDYRTQIMRFIPSSLPQGAIDSLTSFAYNCGVAALQKSTLLKKINLNPLDLKGIEAEYNKWVNGGGKVLPGLVKRRKEEYHMYEEAMLGQYTKKELLYMEPK